MSKRVAIVVAMEREVAPLVTDLEVLEVLQPWTQQKLLKPNGRAYYVSGGTMKGTLIACGGIGRKASAMATHTVVQHYEPDLIISAGLAGALDGNIAAGAVIHASEVYDGVSGQKYLCERDRSSGAVLVTAASVLSREEKEKLAEKFNGDAVDMEAAAVAEVAQASGVAFVAIKAISDPLEFEMPPMDRFINAAGKLNLLKLIGYAALRPRIWGVLNELRKNSRIASEALAKELEKIVAELG